MEETLMRHSSSRKPLAFEELKCQGVGSNEPYSDKPENSEEKKIREEGILVSNFRRCKVQSIPQNPKRK